MIGNPLRSSPDFPPLCTERATFIALGAPSNSAVQGFKHNLHTSLQHSIQRIMGGISARIRSLFSFANCFGSRFRKLSSLSIVRLWDAWRMVYRNRPLSQTCPKINLSLVSWTYSCSGERSDYGVWDFYWEYAGCGGVRQRKGESAWIFSKCPLDSPWRWHRILRLWKPMRRFPRPQSANGQSADWSQHIYANIAQGICQW